MGKKKCLKIMEEFRKAKIQVSESLGKDSLKDQMARASRVGAKLTVIIGQKEALDETAIIRNMKTGRQDTVDIKNIVSEVKKMLKES